MPLASAACGIILTDDTLQSVAVDARTEGDTLQGAFADALRIAGTGARPDYDQIAGIGRRLRPSMLGIGIGIRGQRTENLRQIAELALTVRGSPCHSTTASMQS